VAQMTVVTTQPTNPPQAQQVTRWCQHVHGWGEQITIPSVIHKIQSI
jgi:hypothetical protein